MCFSESRSSGPGSPSSRHVMEGVDLEAGWNPSWQNGTNKSNTVKTAGGRHTKNHSNRRPMSASFFKGDFRTTLLFSSPAPDANLIGGEYRPPFFTERPRKISFPLPLLSFAPYSPAAPAHPPTQRNTYRKELEEHKIYSQPHLVVRACQTYYWTVSIADCHKNLVSPLPSRSTPTNE